MKLFLRTTVVFVIACFAPFAAGQSTPTLYYVGGPTGNYDTTANWNTSNFAGLLGSIPGGGVSRIPLSTDIVLINADTNAGTTLGVGSSGTVNLSLTSNHTLVGLQVANYIINDTTIVNFNITGSNTLTVTGRAGDVGTGKALFGDLVIEGGVTYNQTGGTQAVNRGLIVIGDNVYNTPFSDYDGPGTYNIKSGALNFDPAGGPAGSTTEMDIGSGIGSIGTVTQGSVTDNTTSTVTTGNNLYIGYAGGSGTYKLTNGSLLQTGTQAGSIIAIGINTPSSTLTEGVQGSAGTGATGTLTITEGSTLTVGTGDSLQLGASTAPATVNGGGGTLDQNGVGSNVNINGTATVQLGNANSGSGIYKLEAGTLNLNGTSTLNVGAVAGATGSFTETEAATGTSFLIAGAGSTVNIGVAGTGTFDLQGGSADFQNGFNVGANGTLSQSGTSVLTVENTSATIAAGGTYTMTGGTSTFSSVLNNNGTLNLNGGTLNIAVANLTGTGALNFGGGTLKLTSGTTFMDSLAGGTLANGTVSTIDASVGTFTTVTIAQNLADQTVPPAGSPGGGIILKGSDGTSGTALTTFTFTGTNTYTGPTTILGGVLNANAADITHSSALNIGPAVASAGTATTVNLALGGSSFNFGGTLGGSGNLNVNFNAANETLTLANPSNAVSSINITLAANTGPNNSALPGTLQVFGGSFGTISDNGSGSNVIIGDGSSTGTVTFSTATYTGSTTVNAGSTLNAVSLAGSVSNAGTLNVSGPAGIATDVTSNSGTLNTIYIGGNVTLNSGTLRASNIGGSITSPGVLGTQGSVATPSALAIGNNLTSSGTLLVNVNGTNSDSFNATSATVSGVVAVSGVGTKTYKIVTTNTGMLTIGGNGNLNDAGGIITSGDTSLFSSILLEDPTSSNLILSTTQKTLSEFAVTPNQQAVARVLDPLTQSPTPAFTPILNVFNNLPASEIPAALDQLSPESLQYARNISIENSTFMVQTVNGALANLRAGYDGLDSSGVGFVTPGFNSSLGRSLGSLLAYNSPSYHQAAPNGVNYYPDTSSFGPDSSPDAAPSSIPSSSSQTISDSPIPMRTSSSRPGLRQPSPNFSEFIGGDVILADLNQNPNGNAPSKASYTAGDVIAGISYRMTSNLSLGVLFDFNHTDAKTDSNGSKTTVNSYSPGIYATYFQGGFYVNGLFSFGYNTYSNNRNIPVLGTTANSSPNGQQYVTNLDVGYDFHPDKAKQWTVGPTLGLTYTHLDIDSFTESGAGAADLTVNSQSVDSLRSRLGGHVVFQTHTGNILLQPNFTAMWQHEYLDDNSGITSQFNGLGSAPFTIQTASMGKDSALLGVGLTATLDNSMAFYLNYVADVGADNYFAQSVIGGFKARF